MQMKADYPGVLGIPIIAGIILDSNAQVTESQTSKLGWFNSACFLKIEDI